MLSSSGKLVGGQDSLGSSRPYEEPEADCMLKSMLAGAAATRVMTDVMDNAPKAGLAKVDMASILGSLFNDGQSAEKGTDAWRGGMVVHYLLGALIFPFAYHLIFKRLLFGGPKLKSLEWGVGLWGAGQYLVMPMLRKYGYFKQAPDAKLTYLIGHVVYGALFGGEQKKK